MLLMTAVTGAWATEVTVTKTVNDLFPSVANGTQEATLYSDANLSISVNPDGNNGKVYGTGTEWRLYQVNSAVVTVTATEATIKTVAFTFTATNNGIIKYGGNAMTSGTAVNVNAASAQFVVGNSGAATNGQVRISGFTVVYETGSGSGEEAPTTKHLITATFDKQTRSLEQPLPYATTVGELYEAVTGEPFSDLISTMSLLEMPLNGITSNNTSAVSIGELNGASTPVTFIADGQATVSFKFGNYAKGIYLSVTPPLYVTMKDGTQDADKWTVKVGEGQAQALPIGGLKGDGTETVTLKYNGRLKVKGVKATSDAAPAAPKTLAEATVGMIVGSDGKTYAAADKDNLPDGVNAVALVCYVSDGHGLALALTDESGKMTWNTAKSTCSGKTPAVTGCTWKLATRAEWENMITAAGGFAALRDGFSSVGGTNMLSGEGDYYWSSSTTGSDCAWCCTFSTGNWTDDYVDNSCTDYVRACLEF